MRGQQYESGRSIGMPLATRPWRSPNMYTSDMFWRQAMDREIRTMTALGTIAALEQPAERNSLGQPRVPASLDRSSSLPKLLHARPFGTYQRWVPDVSTTSSRLPAAGRRSGVFVTEYESALRRTPSVQLQHAGARPRHYFPGM